MAVEFGFQVVQLLVLNLEFLQYFVQLKQDICVFSLVHIFVEPIFEGTMLNIEFGEHLIQIKQFTLNVVYGQLKNLHFCHIIFHVQILLV